MSNKFKLIKTVDGQGSAGLKSLGRPSLGDRSRNAELGNVVYKKIKIFKIHQKLKQKPTVTQTSQIFDDLITHLEKKNGSDQDLVSCLRQIHIESQYATEREPKSLSATKQINSSLKDATKLSIQSSLKDFKENLKKSKKQRKMQKSFQ